MDSIYLVLDGTNATLSDDDSHLNWALDEYLFSNYTTNTQFMIELISSQFIGNSTLEDVSLNSIEIFTNLNLKNQTNTKSNGGYKLLGTVAMESVIDGTETVISSIISYIKHPKFLVSKFTNITIYCYHHTNNVKLVYLNKNYCKFILKLTKIKN